MALDYLGHLLETKQIQADEILTTIQFFLRLFAAKQGNATAMGNLAWAL